MNFFSRLIVIIGGDFNCYDNELDKFGGNTSLTKYFCPISNPLSVLWIFDIKATHELVKCLGLMPIRPSVVAWTNF